MAIHIDLDVLKTVLSFAPRKELNDYLFVSKAWAKIIERGGKELDQKQVIDMLIQSQVNEPLALEFSCGEKIIQLTMGQENPEGDVLKNSLVAKLEVDGEINAIEARLQQIKALVGDQSLPVKKVELTLNHGWIPILTRFRAIYSGLIYMNHLSMLN